MYFNVALCYLVLEKCLMPRDTQKSKPISLRLSPHVRSRVRKLSEDTGLIQAQLYDLILRAACKALEEQEDLISLPLKFQVVKPKAR